MNKQGCKISVIVPILNGEIYFDEMMQSLINQTMKEIEIIVVDAGSTDRTQELVHAYMKNDTRIKLLLSDKKSVGYQYNLGIQNAAGEYVAFCEADDYLSLTMLEKLYNLAEKNSVDYIKSTFRTFISKDKERHSVINNFIGAEYRDLYNKVINPEDYDFLLSSDVYLWNGIYRKSFLVSNSIRLNESKGASFQDIGFVLWTLLSAKRVMYVREESYNYRKDNDNSSIYDATKIRFHYQEFEYYSNVIRPHIATIKQSTKLTIIRRFINGIVYGCSFVPHSKEEEYYDLIENALLLVEKEMNNCNLDDQSCEIVLSNLGYTLMKQNKGMLFELERIKRDTQKEKRDRFINALREKSKIYIFGAGDCGRYTLAFIKSLNLRATIRFLDNDDKKVGMNVDGTIIYAPEECVDKDAIYLICNNKFRVDIRKQLISMGIEEFKIFNSIITKCSEVFNKDLD